MNIRFRHIERYVVLLLSIIFTCSSITACHKKRVKVKPKISVAYVQSHRPGVPDPNLFTHLIYSFAVFNDDNDGVVIENDGKLKAMSELKHVNPNLKIILGVGGLKREGFSEMAGDKTKRTRFVDNCARIIKEYNLDGIDLDWEFPTTEKGGHSASPDDDVNYGLVVKELRKKLGKNKWISFYSNNSANWIDFDRMLPYVDYVNVSGYNLDMPKPDKPMLHQSRLYKSKRWGKWCVEESIKTHIKKGVPVDKIILGIPFYARGKKPFPEYLEGKNYSKYDTDARIEWDDEAKVPFMTDENGNMILGFENERSIQAKCDFIKEYGLAGAFIWNYNADYEDFRLSKALKAGLR